MMLVEDTTVLESNLKELLKGRRLKYADKLVSEIIDVVKRSYRFRVIMNTVEIPETVYIRPGESAEVRFESQVQIVEEHQVEVNGICTGYLQQI